MGFFWLHQFLLALRIAYQKGKQLIAGLLFFACEHCSHYVFLFVFRMRMGDIPKS